MYSVCYGIESERDIELGTMKSLGMIFIAIWYNPVHILLKRCIARMFHNVVVFGIYSIIYMCIPQNAPNYMLLLMAVNKLASS